MAMLLKTFQGGKKDEEVVTEGSILVETQKIQKSLSVYKVYLKNKAAINSMAGNNKAFENFLLRGKELKERMRGMAERANANNLKFSGLKIRMHSMQEAGEDELTYQRLSACIAYKYYLDKCETTDDFITPAMATRIPAIATVPRFERMRIIAVSGSVFIPRMIMETPKRKNGDVGLAMAVNMAMDWMRYRSVNLESELTFNDYAQDSKYGDSKESFWGAVKNLGELMEDIEQAGSKFTDEDGAAFSGVIGAMTQPIMDRRIAGKTRKAFRRIMYKGTKDDAYKPLETILEESKV